MSVPPGVRRRVWLVALAFALGAAAVAVVIGRTFSPTMGAFWLAVAVPALGYELWFLRSNAALVGEDAATLGLANGVTLLRGWLYGAVAGFLLFVPPSGSAWRWLPVLGYGGGAALDWVDGVVARSVGRPTELGRKLDMAFDTLGFLVAPLVAVAWGRLPVWYLSLSAARYLFKAGRGLRRRRGKPVFDLPDSRVRRPLAGLQMAFITAALVPVVPVEVVRVAAVVVLLPSLAVFGRDYLVVAGYLRDDNTHATVDRPFSRER